MTEANVLTADLAGTAQAWSAPSMEGVAALGSRRVSNVRDIVAQEEELYEQAKADGHAEGLAAAQAEIDARLRQLDAQSKVLAAALDALARPLELVDIQVQRQLAELAIAIGAQLLHRELKINPSQVLAIVRDTVALLPAAARDVRVSLHPADAALLRGPLPATESGNLWTILDDPSLSRGDCRASAESAQVDARLATRLAAISEELLDEEPLTESPGGLL
jgi:flagellar assembly protein FliH